MVKVFVLGANGLVGTYVRNELNLTNYDVLYSARKNNIDEKSSFIEMNYLDLENLLKILNEFRPQVIVNCAAYTNVDKAETDKQNASYMNHIIVESIGHWSVLNNAHLIHISTDYVYDGKFGPYNETSIYNPINYYGRTKLDGDLSLISMKNLKFTIFRAIVVYGYHDTKLNFVTWAINELKMNRTISIVNDQFGNFTYAQDIAKMIVFSINKKFGIYNIAGDYIDSRYNLCLKIAKIFEFNSNNINSISSIELNQIAIRPLKSGLLIEKSKKDLNFIPTPIESALLEIKKHLS